MGGKLSANYRRGVHEGRLTGKVCFEGEGRCRAVCVMENFLLCFNQRHLSILIGSGKFDLKEN